MEATWSRVTEAVTGGMRNHPAAAVGALILIWVSWLVFTPRKGAQVCCFDLTPSESVTILKMVNED